MLKKFYKVNGVGNVFILFDFRDDGYFLSAPIAKRLCDRKYIGADGVISLTESKIADVKMRLFNADGSEGKICGNGLRCVGVYLGTLVKKSRFSVETASGVRELRLFEKHGKKFVTVDMQRPDFSPNSLPTRIVPLKDGTIVDQAVDFSGEEIRVTCVSMGNPHAVVFSDGVSDFEKTAERIADPAYFPKGVNVEIATQKGANKFFARVLERGCGETLACGSGACAIAVAGVRTGRAEKNADVRIEMRGGTLTVRVTDETVFLTGEAEIEFESETEI